MTGEAVSELGVFARVFPPGTPKEVASAIAGAGYTTTQLNLSVLGRPTLDAGLSRSEATSIRASFADQGVGIWGLSGTFNMIDPDPSRRQHCIDDAIELIRSAPDVSAEVVTLCTGTRDADNMWRVHPDNTSPPAWQDLLDTFEQLLPAAEAAGVQLGVEPEPGNVVRDAAAADRLLADLGGDARLIGIVLDPANLLTPETAPSQGEILGDAFERLGAATVAVHAKDVVSSGYAAPGHGVMDYDLVMRLHHSLPREVPIIAQDLTADDASRVYRFLRDHAANVRA
jgi:sugar phosphate isomerase/epimerase